LLDSPALRLSLQSRAQAWLLATLRLWIETEAQLLRPSLLARLEE
jgi:hypothetical protein